MQIEGEIETAEAALTGTYAREEPAGRPRGDAATEGLPRGDDPTTPETSVEDVDHLLDEVEQALSRLDDGTYGQCETCGGPIDDSRLAGEPTARQCADCQAAPHS